GGAEVLGELAGLHHAQGFVVEELEVLLVDLGGLDAHRAVDEDWERTQLLALEGAGEEEEQELGAADGEGRDEDASASGRGLAGGGAGLDGGALEGLVVAVAVGGFHEDQVGVLEGRWVLVEGCAARADVAGEDDDFGGAVFADRDLEAGGAQDVAGFDGAD